MRIYRSILLICSALTVFVSNAREIEIEQLSDSGVIVTDTPLACREDLGLFCALGNRIMALESPDMLRPSEFLFPDSVRIDGFYFEGRKLVSLLDNVVLWADSVAGYGGMAFEDNDFDICRATDSTFYVVRPSECSVIEFSMSRKEALSYYYLDEAPVTAGKFGNSTVVVCQNNIYLVLGDDTSVMHSHPREIRAAAVTPMGIYFGTDSALWRVVDFDRLEHVADGSISRIVGAGDLFYVVDGTGALYKFTLLSE